MTRLLAITATALAMGLAPVLAAEPSSPSTPPTAITVSPEASKSATTPPSGSADTSGGATEQSSSSPSAGSTMGKMGEEPSSTSQIDWALSLASCCLTKWMVRSRRWTQTRGLR
jgi:hypothetical protein